jgi:urea transporter
VRFDLEDWADSAHRALAALDRLELAVAVVVVAGGVAAGVAVLLGIALLPTALVGAALAVIGVIVAWALARRKGTTVFGDD